MSQKSSRQEVACIECQAGRMRQRKVTFFAWLGDQLISVPDFPAWICDICGQREYDFNALNELNLILNPSAGRPTARSRSIPKQQEHQRPSRAKK